jgi:hypothetical protein
MAFPPSFQREKGRIPEFGRSSDLCHAVDCKTLKRKGEADQMVVKPLQL